MTSHEKALFEQDIEAYSDTVLRIAVQNTRCYQDAEDITQEVFMRLMKSYGTFSDESHKKAWLIRVTINLCRDLCRSFAVKKVQPLEDYPCVSEDAGLRRCEILEAIRKLPEARRNAVYLFYYEGMGVEEIAAATGRSVGTVGSDLHRARKQLRIDLEE